MRSTVEDWGEVVRASDVEAFSQAHRHPFLVDEAAAVGGEEEDREVQFRTVVGDEAIPGTVGASDLGKLRVQPLVKRESGAFEGLVHVGRTANNDIVLDDPSISKFHAFFVRDQLRRIYQLSDAGSMNGTFVDGERLAEGDRRDLSSRQNIRFGTAFSFRFHEPDGFHEFVRLVVG